MAEQTRVLYITVSYAKRTRINDFNLSTDEKRRLED